MPACPIWYNDKNRNKKLITFISGNIDWIPFQICFWSTYFTRKRKLFFDNGNETIVIWGDGTSTATAEIFMKEKLKLENKGQQGCIDGHLYDKTNPFYLMGM